MPSRSVIRLIPYCGGIIEHNYGLGKQYLSMVFVRMMMLAFLVDQTQQLCCTLFQAVSKVSAKKLEVEGEILLYCESSGRARKEEAMKTLFQKRFEGGLQTIAESLTKKRGIKDYGKVLQRIGRLRQRFPSVSQFYEITVEHEGEIAMTVKRSVKEEDKLAFRFSGAYLIRTDRTDLDEKGIWSLYMMLTQVEDAFRSLPEKLPTLDSRQKHAGWPSRIRTLIYAEVY